MNRKKAIVFGVGPEQGLGAALAAKFIHEGHHVFIASRSITSLESLATKLSAQGGKVTPIQCDTTNEQDVCDAFTQVSRTGEGTLDLCVFNVGNSMPGTISEMQTEFFVKAWNTLCLGGFLVGRECCNAMNQNGGTLIYTGASASLRGKAGYGAFNSGKAALRTFAQALAKEQACHDIHVAHVIIDGGIAGDKWLKRRGLHVDEELKQRLISLDGLADAYWSLYKQAPSAWTFELDIRTNKEQW